MEKKKTLTVNRFHHEFSYVYGFGYVLYKSKSYVTTIFVTDSDSFQLKIVHVLESSTQANVTRHTQWVIPGGIWFGWIMYR